MRGSRRPGVGSGRRGGGVKPSSAIAWNPLAIAACELWLRADLGITLNGGNVSAWADQAPVSDDAAQGTAANQPAYNTAGSKPYVNFDGSNDRLDIPDSARLSPTTAFSIVCWVYQDTSITRDVSSKYDSSIALQHVLRSDGGRFSVFVGALATFGQTPAASAPAGAWHHVAVVYDGSQPTAATRLKIWIDGVLQTLSLTVIPTSVADVAAVYTIGTWPAGASPWNGRIWEYLFYSAPITATDVGLLYAYSGPT